MDTSVSLQTLLTEFKCFVCLEYMHPPIRLCETGHSMCESCWKILQTCPLCAAAVQNLNIRNYALENIHDQIIFPCKYGYLGCKMLLTGKEIIDHENLTCKHGPKMCPFTWIGFTTCKWVGNITNVVQHCKETHSDNTLINFFINKKSIPNPNHSHIKTISKYDILFNVLNEIFIFHWETLWKENCCMLRCGVFLISRPEINEFSFEVKLENPKGQTIILAGPCKQFDWMNDNTMINATTSKSCLIALLGHSKVLVSTYSVKIFDGSASNSSKADEEVQSNDSSSSSNAYHGKGDGWNFDCVTLVSETRRS